jgi:Mrp family chromosome partitioning ATPase/capsular polysaccharide biosynthesis protein
MGRHSLTRRSILGVRSRWVLLVVPVLAAVLAGAWTARQPASYESRTTLLVTQLAAGDTPGQVLNIPASEELARTYGRLVTTSPVLQRVIAQMHLDTDVRELKRRIDVSVGTASQLIEIHVEAPSRREAEALATVLASTFIRSRAADRSHGSRIAVAEPAQPPDDVAPSPLAAGLVAAVFGVALALGLVIVRDRFLEPIGKEAQLEEATGSRVLVTIPQLSRGRRERGRAPLTGATVSEEDRPVTDEPAFESYRLLRTIVESALGRAPKTLMLVTAPVSGSGVSTTVTNLALAFAQIGRRVLVVDCNLGAPSQHERFGFDNDAGLADLLERGSVTMNAFKRKPSGVAILATGAPTGSSADLLASTPTTAVLRGLAADFDITLLDAPPARTADTRILGPIVDHALLVVDPRRSSISAVREAVESMGDDKVLGIVVNRAREPGSVETSQRERGATPALVEQSRAQTSHGEIPAAPRAVEFASEFSRWRPRRRPSPSRP